MNKLKRAVILIGMVFTIQTAGSAILVPPVDSHARTTYVWIAPHYGKKYHFSRNCRGLNNAGYERHVTIHWARAHHYRLCGFEK
ncbi:hypothetical protein [Lentilactobacillus kosonis]|uniref:hypothetical protein n=1 Tax=Lentilactobacillus kosonis TaxID=2810561 RepID=UPI000F61ADC4|nr:hypothetical protein [Lentilactobacillus kosonis]